MSHVSARACMSLCLCVQLCQWMHEGAQLHAREQRLVAHTLCALGHIRAPPWMRTASRGPTMLGPSPLACAEAWARTPTPPPAAQVVPVHRWVLQHLGCCCCCCCLRPRRACELQAACRGSLLVLAPPKSHRASLGSKSFSTSTFWCPLFRSPTLPIFAEPAWCAHLDAPTMHSCTDVGGSSQPTCSIRCQHAHKAACVCIHAHQRCAPA